MKILITRPKDFAGPLADSLKASGFETILFPTIAFGPPPEDMRLTIRDIANFDWLIFVSRYAVEAFKEKFGSVAKNVSCAAIGEGTAQAMQSLLGIKACAQPPVGNANSEALLDLPHFSEVKGSHIGIVRGVGGREYLEKILQARGARLTSLVLYQRLKPIVNIAPYLSELTSSHIHVIVCTSFESVNNLTTMLGKAAFHYLQKIPLIVISERIKRLAQDLGFQTIWVASNASHTAIVDTINILTKRMTYDH